MEDYRKADIADIEGIKAYVINLGEQKRELILTQNGKTLGAILTAAQYEWFLNQLENSTDVSFIGERSNDLSGSQSLKDFKKDLGL